MTIQSDTSAQTESPSSEGGSVFSRLGVLPEFPPLPVLTDGPAAFYAGKVKCAGKITTVKDKYGTITDYVLSFSYNEQVLKRVKQFAGRKWIAASKSWSIPRNQRNEFQLHALMGHRVYQRYDQKWTEFVERISAVVSRPLYKHQMEMLAFELLMGWTIIGAEMGTGKSLVNLQAIEMVIPDDERITPLNTWIISTKSGLASMQQDFYKWKSRGQPRWLTYEGMVSTMKKWNSGDAAPRCVIFDEASKLKNATSQRSQAALALSNAVRREWGRLGLITAQTGTPAPKSPIDWWNLCEVVCPGFLVEGEPNILQNTLGITQLCEAPTGQKFMKVLGWKDDRKLCAVCAKRQDDPIHSPFMFDHHMYEPCEDEVSRLHKRMNGLLLVKMKKDCLDLPPKRYEVITLTPSPEVIRAADLVSTIAPTAAQALILLREISDGFKYRKEDTGEAKDCPCCRGTGNETIYFEIPNEEPNAIDQPDGPLDSDEEPTFIGRRELFDAGQIESLRAQGRLATEEVVCAKCKGEKQIRQVERHTDNFISPKDDVLRDLLEKHEECGRFVVFAGFTGSVDKCEALIQKEGWCTIRIDGRSVRFCNSDGAVVSLPPVGGLTGLARMVHEFQDKESEYDKICVIAHPASGGTGLTLTRSPGILYYSNSFSGDDRTQSEDRIHRLGMDNNIGATIYDIVHLPVDQLVLDNLRKKRRLELLTLGDLQGACEINPDNRLI